MFSRCNRRSKDGKEHRYCRVVENRRWQCAKVAQRSVLYRGEINDSQRAAWRKSRAVCDESAQRYTTLSLFPEDRPLPPDGMARLPVQLSEMELRRRRMFANCWLGCERWQQWGRDGFFAEQFPPGREAVPGAKVLELLLVNRLIDPGSQFRLQRQWFDHSARGELLGLDFAVAEKDRLDRCRDPLLPHKRELFLYLRQRWATLFGARFDILLYDLTSP